MEPLGFQLLNSLEFDEFQLGLCFKHQLVISSYLYAHCIDAMLSVVSSFPVFFPSR
jgi:hypothetical protein